MPKMNLDEAKEASLGMTGGGKVYQVRGVMRYVAGVIQRERKRLARAVQGNGQLTGEVLAKKILDTTDDDRIFKWAGLETGLNDS